MFFLDGAAEKARHREEMAAIHLPTSDSLRRWRVWTVRTKRFTAAGKQADGGKMNMARDREPRDGPGYMRSCAPRRSAMF